MGVDKIKFGTDGWRAVIGDTYTNRNVARVAEAVAHWVKLHAQEPKVVIGHDCRFNGKMFMETVIRVLVNYKIKVYYGEGFVSTPMISKATRDYGATMGIILTASHNPASYGGFKLKSSFGGPLLPENINEVENYIQEKCSEEIFEVDLEKAKKDGLLEEAPFEKEYIDAVKESFDLDAIRNSGMNFVYDAMYGAGQNVMKKLFPKIDFLHCVHNPGFMGQAPEPIAKNLKELEQFIKEKGTIDVALATDGDADRIGLYNAQGEFVDSHHIILLLIHYLVKYKGIKGKVITAFSTSPKIKKMCQHYGLEHETVQIGFKHIAGKMATEDVLLGGEESGGIAIKGHIPERDGIWMGMVIWEFMAKSGKTLTSLIDEVYEIVGEFKFERSDLHIDEELKSTIVENCKNNVYEAFGEYKIERIETIDGFKFFFADERWVMIRPSGTEPVLRVYAEAEDLDKVREILRATENTILN